MAESNCGFVSLRSNPTLGTSISKFLETYKDSENRLLPIPTVDTITKDFGNTEIKVKIADGDNNNVRNKRVFILQTGAATNGVSVNHYLMELLIMIRTCQLSDAESITAVIPNFPYARSDKKDESRVAIGAKLTMDLLKVSGCNRIICVDLHAGQIQGMTNMPVDNLYAIDLFIKHINENIFSGLTHEEINDRFILVSPDNGGAKRVDAFASKLKMDFVIMHKQRDHSQTSCITKSILIGNSEQINGKTGIVIDDMVDTMGTMCNAAKELREKGMKNVIVIATHGILSEPAISRINDCDCIEQVIVTNTLPQEQNQILCPKLNVVDISVLLSEAIHRTATGKSISKLFK